MFSVQWLHSKIKRIKADLKTMMKQQMAAEFKDLQSKMAEVQPKPVSEDEVVVIVQQVVGDTLAKSVKDMETAVMASVRAAVAEAIAQSKTTGNQASRK